MVKTADSPVTPEPFMCCYESWGAEVLTTMPMLLCCPPGPISRVSSTTRFMKGSNPRRIPWTCLPPFSFTAAKQHRAHFHSKSGLLHPQRATTAYYTLKGLVCPRFTRMLQHKTRTSETHTMLLCATAKVKSKNTEREAELYSQESFLSMNLEKRNTF